MKKFSDVQKINYHLDRSYNPTRFGCEPGSLKQVYSNGYCDGFGIRNNRNFIKDVKKSSWPKKKKAAYISGYNRGFKLSKRFHIEKTYD